MKYLRASLPYIAIASISMLLGFMYKYHLPRFKDWLKVQIESASRTNSPVGILSKSLELNLWPIGIALQDVSVIPKASLANNLSKITAKQIVLGVSPLAILRGRPVLNEVQILSPRFTYIHRESKGFKKLPDDLDKEIFKTLKSLPIAKIVIEDMNALIKIEDIKVVAKLSQFNMKAINEHNKLRLIVASPSISIKNQADQARVDIGMETDLIIDPRRLEISTLKMERGRSLLVVNGFLEDSWFLLKPKIAHIKLRSQLDFPELQQWISTTFPWISLPQVSGTSAIDIVYSQSDGTEPNIEFSGTSKDLKIGHFDIGDATIQGTRDKNLITLTKGKIRNQAGNVDASKTVFELDPNRVSFKSQVKGNIELRKLLAGLGVGQTPLNLEIQTGLSCDGTLKPKLVIDCDGNAKGSDFVVHSGGTHPATIVALDEFSTSGKVSITSESVNYDTKIHLGAYSGTSSGTIHYNNGFKITYATPILGFDAINNLVNLDFTGVSSVIGTTQGNASHATIDMQIDSTRLGLEGFNLGDVTAKLKYQDGVLSFRDLSGGLRNSRYAGVLSINLLKQRLFLATKLPYLDANDINLALAHKLPLPFQLTGSGAANVRVWGPLKLNELSLDLTSSIFRGAIAGESFDQLNIGLKAKDGLLRTEQTELIKNRARAVLNGKITPQGEISATLRGRFFRLEDSSVLSSMGLNMTGQLDFDTSFRGLLKAPEIETTGTLTQMTVGATSVPNSKFRLVFSDDRLEGQGNFLGQTLYTSFMLPYDSKGPFSLKLKSKNWDFAPLFSILSDRTREQSYETKLTTDIDLYAESGGIWNASGQMRLKDLLVKRGPLEMSNPKESVIDFKRGSMSTKDLLLTGPGTFFRIQAIDSQFQNLNVTVNGKLNLGLMALFTPFFDDLRGNLSTSFKVAGQADHMQIIGTSFIDDGYIKIRGFPHAFENLKADLLYSQNKVIINSAQSILGGGTFTAHGRMDINGFNNIPTQIEGNLSNVTLNVPEGVKITGSGPVLISGNWFPFLISGTFNVSNGLVDKEFGGSEFSGAENKYTNFLPDFLLRESFEPIQLDIQVNGEEAIKVKNSIIDTQLTGALRVKGTPNQPIISGQLTSLMGGKLFFNDTEFEVRAADLKFAGEKDIDPIIYLEASTRIQSYDIQLLVQGKASRPKIEMSSSPSLPERDIISLLALGITTTDIEKNMNLGEQTNQSYYQIGTALLSKTNIKDITDRLGIDFQLSSGFNPSDNIAENRWTLSKQVNKKLGISFSRVIGGDVVKEEYEVKYRLNSDLAVIGSLKQRRDEAETSDRLKVNPSEFGTLGLDLEYKIEFK